jgi:putative tryptophan/tyrosine transport system substrate-binding protein
MRLSTIGLLVIFALGTLSLPLAAAVPPKKVPTIGVLTLDSPPSEPDWKQHSVFLQELRHLGWREGENVMVEYRWASGQFDRVGDLTAELVRLNVAVIYVSNTTLIRAVQHATTTIPIVMVSIDDPVEEGFIASLARPGGNITGVDASFIMGLGGKLLESLTEVVPPHSRVAILSNPNTRVVADMLQEVKVAAQALGITLQFLEARKPDEFASAFDTARREGAGALLILPSVVFFLHLKQLAALAVQHRLPAIYSRPRFAQEGGLLTYGPSDLALLRRVAYYVDRILRGAKPADLPVERPTKFDLIINLKTAETLDLTIPPALLFQADEVIR